jgi:CheY-like chemotaxis protein
LIADDNQDGAETLGMLLQLDSHEVHLAHDGAAAFAMAERLRPDVAVLDIGMPGLTGYEVAERIRAEVWGRQMLLIAVTGWGQQSDKEKAQLAGFDHHLTKPMDPIELGRLFAGTRRNAAQ